MPAIRTSRLLSWAAGAVLAAAAGDGLCAADWPMYRMDAARGAATADPLADTLHKQWSWKLPPRVAAFATDRRNPVDEITVPVIAGGLVLLGNEHDRALLAIDLGSGELRWRFVADAPFRFAPAVADGTVFAAADDGNLYALDLASGQERWRYAGAPSPRKVVNHLHLGSAWPASGGPVVKDGTVYFSTGILPIDGTWMHAVDARTGQRRWRSPAEVCWGYAAVIGDWVAVPSGMFPNTFDAATGAVRRNGFWGVKNLSPNRLIGYTADYLWIGNQVHPLAAGRPMFGSQYLNAEHGANMWSPVVDGDRAYGINDGVLRGVRLPRIDEAPPEFAGNKGARHKSPIQVLGDWWINARPDLKWSQVGEPLDLPAGVQIPPERIRVKRKAAGIGWNEPMPAGDGATRPWYPRRLELKAGSTLVAGGPQWAVGIKLAAEGEKPKVTFVLPVSGQRQEYAAADGRLVASCDDGTVLCFGPQAIAQPRAFAPPAPEPIDAAMAAAALLDAAGTGAREGYAVVAGDAEGRLGEAIAAGCKAMVSVLVGERADSLAIRARLGAAGRLERNLGVIEGGLRDAQLPPYALNLLVVADGAAAAVADAATLAAIYAPLRPFGGTACLALDEGAHQTLATAAAGLPGAQVRRAGRWSLLTRSGPLPRSDNWTHERHSPANTLRSNDTAIGAPMGMLWIGGPSTEWQTRLICDGLYQGIEVVDGRYTMLGMGVLSAIDAYTGRLLWETKLPTAQRYVSYIELLKGPDGKPLYPEPDAQVWQGNHAGLTPGDIEVARQVGDGFNVVSMPDAIYVTVAEELWVISPADGSVQRKLKMPVADPAARRPLCWGSIRIVGDQVVATAFDPARWRELFPVWAQGNEKSKQRLPTGWLFAADLASGRLLWQRKAEQGFQSWGIAVGKDRVFAIDLVTSAVIDKSGPPAAGTAPALIALDLASGEQKWRKPLDAEVCDIAYSAERDLVLAPSRELRRWKDAAWVAAERPVGPGGKPGALPSQLVAVRGADGEQAWRIDNDEFAEPLIVNGDVLLTRRGRGYVLATGAPAMRNDPLTGQPEQIEVSTGGCNFLLASPEFTTHRTCYDVTSVGCTMPFEGIRSGCTPSMVPAAGLISIFNQAMEENTELRSNGALVARPDNVNWTSFAGRSGDALLTLAGSAEPLPRLALDLAAPGDHLGRDGTPWLRLLPVKAAAAPKGRAPTAPASAARLGGDDLSTFLLPVPGLAAQPGAAAIVAASGVEGAATLTIRLGPAGKGQRYTVRLHFLEPDAGAKPGARVQTIAVQGKDAITDLDLAKEAGPLVAVVRELKGVEVAGELTIALRASAGRTLLCGVEAIAELAR